MLDSEEVDDDYFTPISKTSLASIFKKSSINDDRPENESLKYTPPIPKPVQWQEESSKKSYETVFSCVFDAYAWLDNVYVNKGKLGCAVVKHNSAEGINTFNSVLLYDSKKTTISSAIASKELEVILKDNNMISYYDLSKKYWCLYGSESDISRFIEVLKSSNVTVKHHNNEKYAKTSGEIQSNLSCNKEKTIESDTDSSINRKTKASILTRMANMGQSVLPPKPVSTEQSSDSSDTNMFESQIIATRHKTNKNISKKPMQIKHLKDLSSQADVKTSIFPITSSQDVTSVTTFTQMVPLLNTVAGGTTSGQDLSYFLAEQRVANSELRINMTRVTDKVDDIMNKLNNIELSKNQSSPINTDIYQKLLKEYESKIQNYEELIQKLSVNNSAIVQYNSIRETEKNELINLNSKIAELSNTLKQKDHDISTLHEEIKILKAINVCEDHFHEERTEYTEMPGKIEDGSSRNLKVEIEQKIKQIMNDTFQAIELNFNEGETYSGEYIKNKIATVIKRVTIDSLKENNDG